MYFTPELIFGIKTDYKDLALLKQELIRFRYSLSEWYEHNPDKDIITYYTPEKIWKNSMLYGPAFADEYADYWENNLRQKLSVSDFCIDFEKEKRFVRYNDYFPLKQFFRWFEEPDDLKYYNIPYSVSDDDKELLTDLIFSFLPEELKIPNEDLITSEKRLTSSFDINSICKDKHYKLKLNKANNKFSEKINAVRTKVYTYPTSCRDTVVIDPESLNTVNWVSSLTADILKDIPESLLGCIDGDFYRRINRLKKNSYKRDVYNYLPDIKKAGITMPRYFYRCYYNALIKKYGDKEEFKRVLAFERFSLVSENFEKITTTRGVGLGMNVNELTLFLCCIHKLRVRGCPYVFDGGYFNDDQIVQFRVPDDMEAEDIYQILRMEDENLCNRFGLILHQEKTFCSKTFLFLEQYTHRDFCDKSAAHAASLGLAFALPDIRTAKEFTSILCRNEGESKNLDITRLIEFWGYEFDIKESSRCYFLGGWIKKKRNYLYDILCDICEISEVDLPYFSRIHDSVIAQNIVKGYNLKLNQIELSESQSYIGHKNNIHLLKKIDIKTYGELNSILATDSLLKEFFDALEKKIKQPRKLVSEKRKFSAIYKKTKLTESYREDMLRIQIEEFDRLTYRIPKKLVTSYTSNYMKYSDTSALESLTSRYDNKVNITIAYLRDMGYIKTNMTKVINATESLYHLCHHDFSEGKWTAAYMEYDKEDLPDFTYGLSDNPYVIIEDYIKEHNEFPTELSIRLKPRNEGVRNFFKSFGIKRFLLSKERGIYNEIFLSDPEYIDPIDLHFVPEDDKEFYRSSDKKEAIVDINDICDNHLEEPSKQIYYSEILNTYMLRKNNPQCKICYAVSTLLAMQYCDSIFSDTERVRKKEECSDILNSMSEKYGEEVSTYYNVPDFSLSYDDEDGLGSMFASNAEDEGDY